MTDAARWPQRPGHYWMRDDESGLVSWDDKMTRIWDGTFRHVDNWEQRNPQEFVRALNDPKALKFVRTTPNVPAPDNTVSDTVGDSTVATRGSPAGHIFGHVVPGGQPE